MFLFLLIPLTHVYAEINSVRIKEGSKLSLGSQYTIVWKGIPTIGADKYSVWLVDGSFNNSESKFLGEVNSK